MNGNFRGSPDTEPLQVAITGTPNSLRSRPLPPSIHIALATLGPVKLASCLGCDASEQLAARNTFHCAKDECGTHSLLQECLTTISFCN